MNDTKSPARDIVKTQPLAIVFALGSVSAANGEPRMHKALIVVIATVALAFDVGLIVALKIKKSTQNTSMTGSAIDTFGLTEARALSE